MYYTCISKLQGFKSTVNSKCEVAAIAEGHLTHTTQSRLLTTLKEKALENTVGNGENAGKQHFLLFPQCFLLFPTTISIVGLH